MRTSLFAPVATLLLVLVGCTAPAPAASPSATAAPTPSPLVTATPELATPSPVPATPTEEPTDEPTEEPTDEPTEEPAGDAATVAIFDFGFNPRTLEVSAGTQVDWTNTGVAPHTVTFDDGEGSGVLDGGGTFQRTFDGAGTFDYLCTIHPAMVGTIEVSE